MGEVVYGTSHAKSVLGILKFLEILTCLLAVILVAVKGWPNDLINAFYAGTIIGIILSLLILVLSLTEAGHSLNGLLRYQFVSHLLMFVYLLIVSSILIARYYSSYHRAGAVSGYLLSKIGTI
ncbi:hypothetical protein HUJ04_003041 [Dendroctonus ponderosae]|nr:hypothetical protein HUJ04_003041 [Dendroctonus ponderosae]